MTAATDDAGRVPAGFAPLARSIARRTTDLLAVALVVAAALGLGRQTISWWRADPGPVAPAAADTFANPWSSGAVPLVLEFGEATHVIERLEVPGTKQSAMDRLVELCADRLESATSPDVPPSEAERRLRDALAHSAPVREKAGQWQVHAVDGPVLLVAGLRDALNASADRAEGASGAPRVLCWGLAFPSGDQHWTLYLFRPAGSGSGTTGGN